MEEFVKDALRTEPDLKAYWNAAGRVAQGIAQDSPGTNYLKLRLLHVGMGLATEAGEFMDALKRHVFYGKELDKTNLIEELGDVTWYLRIACDVLGVSLAEVIQKNVDKLRKRFPDKFTEDKAVNRDLEGERATLEAYMKQPDAIIAPNVAKQEADAWQNWFEDALARWTGRAEAAEKECEVLRAERNADLKRCEQLVVERDSLEVIASRLRGELDQLYIDRAAIIRERNAAQSEVSRWRCASIPTKENVKNDVDDETKGRR